MSTPVRCDRCLHVWPSRGMMITNSQVSMRGNKEGPCPRCGGTGSIQDGEYSYSFDASATILSGPASSFAAFRELYGAFTAPDVRRTDLEAIELVAQSAKAGKLAPDEVADAVAAINPKIAATISSDSVAWASLVLSILALLWSVWTWYDDKADDASQVERDERSIAVLKSIQKTLEDQGVVAPIPQESIAQSSSRQQRRLIARKAEKASRKRTRAKIIRRQTRGW